MVLRLHQRAQYRLYGRRFLTGLMT